MAVPGKKKSQQFSSTMSGGSAEDYKVYCQPCERDDVRVLAGGFCKDCDEHLCDSCLHHHKKAKPSRHHKLLDKENMPLIQQFSTTPVLVGQSLTKPCSKHSQEIIKFHCHDHKVLLCNVCVTLQHNVTSCHVDYIPDVSRQFLDSKEYTDTLKEMDTLSEKCQKITADLKGMITQSNGSFTDVLAEIKKFRQDINEKLDVLEKAAEDAVNALVQQNESRLTTVEMTCDNVTRSLKASADSIKPLNTSKQADRLFMELQSAKNFLKDNEKCLSQLASSDVKEYHFKPNEAIVTLFQKEKSLGKLRETTLKNPSSTRTVDFKSWNPSLQGEICVNTTTDKKMCNITGMVFLNPSKLIVIDQCNSSIKMVDINSKSVSAHLQLDAMPYDVTAVNSHQVVVTLPASGLIQFISVSSNNLIEKHTLKVHEFCYGICYYKDKLLVSFPRKLQILDMKGSILTAFKTNSSFLDKVIANSNFIYLSCKNNNAVLMYSWQGNLLGSQGGIGSPRDLEMLDDGSCLVSDSHTDKRNIKHLSAECTVVLKNMCSNPYAICWCEANCTLCVSYSDLYKKYSSYIHIFKML